MVVVDGLHGDATAAAAVADVLFSAGGDLQAFLDHAGLEVAAAGSGEAAGQGEEEELEWLSNKDAFPAVETMAPKPSVVGPRTKGVRRRRRRRRGAAWSPPPVLPLRSPAAAAAAAGTRWCRHCGTRNTPQWREGPEGRATLCNACGVRYRTGRLVPEYRPANSPTFSPELHSNIHRRVVEMRLCRGSSATAVAGDQ